jgi:plastocyanin
MFKRQRIALTMSIAACAALGTGGWLAGCDDDKTPNFEEEDSGSEGMDSSMHHDTGAVVDTGTNPQDGGADAKDASLDAADAKDAYDAADGDIPYTDNVNGCLSAAYVDRTGAGDTRTVAGPSDGTPVAYVPPCMKIKRGQSVTFTGDMTNHPLQPSTTPNPIPLTADVTTVTIKFPNAGTYGFHCAVVAHQGVMKGAIWVTP